MGNLNFRAKNRDFVQGQATIENCRILTFLAWKIQILNEKSIPQNYKNSFIFGTKIQIHIFFLKIEFLNTIWDFLKVCFILKHCQA